MVLKENHVSDKKITIFIYSLGGGGAERVCVNIANGLTELGWEVSLVVFDTTDSVNIDQLTENVQLTILNKTEVRKSILTMLKYLYGNKPERIMVFNYEIMVLVLLLKRLLLLKPIIILRNINSYSFERERQKGFWRRCIYIPLIDKFINKVNAVINQSYGMQKDLINLFPSIENRSYVIHNPINSKIEQYTSNNHIEKNNEKAYILCVGRLSAQKAFDEAIEIFSILIQDFPNLTLKIAGIGELGEDLKNKVKDLNLEGLVSFEGFQKDLIPYYINASLTLLTSYYEGFPNVLLDSIALGTPVVSYDCTSGPSEIVVQGKNGFLIPNRDREEMIRQIKHLLEFPIPVERVIDTSLRFKRKDILTKYEKLLLEI